MKTVHEAVRTAMQQPSVKAALEREGTEVSLSATPEQFGEIVLRAGAGDDEIAQVAVGGGGTDEDEVDRLLDGDAAAEADPGAVGDQGGVEGLRRFAVAGVAERGFDRLYGARPLARVIQEHIKKPLAEELLFGKLTKGGVVRVLVKDDRIELQIEEPAKPRLTGQKPPLLTAE